MTLHIHTLLHLVSVSIAVGLAYIALDRFRYTKRVKKILRHALDRINAGMKPADEDTTQLRIRRKLKNISDNGLGMKLFFKWGPRTFGVGEKSGWDVYVISVLLGINFISLCLGCIYVAESNQDLFLFMFVVAIIGTIVPVVFIYRGKKHFNITMAYIDEEIDDAAALYNLSIEDFKQSLRELPYG